MSAHGARSVWLGNLGGLVVGAILGALVGLLTPVAWRPAPHAKEMTALETLPDGTTREAPRQPGSVWPGLPRQAEDGSAAEPPPRPPGSIVDIKRNPTATAVAHKDEKAAIPPWLVAPFAALLLSIALGPFLAPRFWHRHYAGVAFALGAFVTAFYLSAFESYGRHTALHVAVEYYQFIGLLAGLYLVSGAIVVDVRAPGRPAANTLLLAFGAVIANLVGTTGASMLLIRPFLRINRGRLRPGHVVFFIFIVSNCGGCLTPIGDPPLYLGFLRGVPFFWTLTNLWEEWLFVVGSLLAMFFVYDWAVVPRRNARRDEPAPAPARAPREGPAVAVTGRLGLVLLPLVVASVLLDPLLQRRFGYHGPPVGAAIQIALGLAARRLADPRQYERNQFSLEPLREVAFLFVGIFATMAPALGYLAQVGASLPVRSPTQFFVATGALSAFLDNAPTYLTFLQLAFAKVGIPLDPPTLQRFVEATFTVNPGTPEQFVIVGSAHLAAISLGAVFFGAATYIGNGPNFMVKAIAEASGAEAPSFFGYLRYTAIILLPVIAACWILLR